MCDMSKCKLALSEQDAIHSIGLGFVVCMKYKIKHCTAFFGTPGTSNNQMTYTISDTSADFLDTTIYKLPNGQLASTLYRKPTDTIQLLHYNSNHPISTKRGVIYSQALRLRRIITEDIYFEEQLQILQRILMIRKYPLELIYRTFNKTRLFSQYQLLFQTKHDKTTQHILPFVIAYNPTLPNIDKILKQHWNIITNDSTLREIYTDTPTIAYKRHENLKDRLVHTKFSTY